MLQHQIWSSTIRAAGIHVIEITGVIDDAYAESICRAMDALPAGALAAVVITSEGGHVSAAETLRERFAARGNLVAAAPLQLSSGALHAALGCQKIIVGPGTQILAHAAHPSVSTVDREHWAEAGRATEACIRPALVRRVGSSMANVLLNGSDKPLPPAHAKTLGLVDIVTADPVAAIREMQHPTAGAAVARSAAPATAARPTIVRPASSPPANSAVAFRRAEFERRLQARMQQPRRAVRAAGDAHNELYLWDLIGPGGITAQAFQTALETIAGPVKIRINSPGGDVAHGVAIFNAIKRARAAGKRITAHVDGEAASMASYIMLAGERVFITENATVMIHEPWAVACGTEADLRSMADGLAVARDSQLIPAYAQKTGKSVTTIRKMLAAETWLGADDALADGFVDEIERTVSAGKNTRSSVQWDESDRAAMRARINRADCPSDVRAFLTHQLAIN